MADDFSIADEDTLAFLTECRELIEEVEPYMVQLGQQTGPDGQVNIETVNYIFRLFHTLKGSASFFQFDNIVRVTHEAETLLELLKQKTTSLPKNLTNILCRTCDFINDMLNQIEQAGSDKGNEINAENLIAELNTCYNELNDLVSNEIKKPRPPVPLKDRTPDELPEKKETLSDNDFSENIDSINPEEEEVKLDDNILIFLSSTRKLLEKTVPYITNNVSSPKKKGKKNGKERIETFTATLKTIKESATFLHLNSIVKVTETSITILNSIQNKKNIPTDEFNNLLVKVYALLNIMLDEIEATGKDDITRNEIDRIITFLHNDSDHDINLISELIIKAIDDFTGKDNKKSSDKPTDDDISGDEYSITPHMLQTFIQESSEQFENIEEILVMLDETPENDNLLEETLRLLHNFKGNCGVMGFKDLERISHHTETLLEKIKETNYLVDAWDIRALLLIIDALQQTVKNLTMKSSGSIKNMNTLIEMLNGMAPTPYASNTQEVIEQDGIFLLRKDENLNKTNLPDPEGKKNQNIDNASQSGNQIPETNPAQNFQKRMSTRQDIRVNLNKLDDLVTLVGELVIAETLVTRNPDLEEFELENFERASNHLSKIVRDIQDITLSIRMIPIHGVFRKMIRLVHDLSSKSDKKVQLVLSGEDTEIDKTIAELIADPLVHIIRNAIDHGIESPKVRKAIGKPEISVINLDAKHEGSEIWIRIKDDGQGLNREKIISKAIEKKLITGDGSTLSDQKVFELIFHPGFSTASKVTDVSGRGVGMDVVKKNIEKIKGFINIKCAPGHWTEFTLRIPLTLAIIEGMLLRVGNTTYTVPMLSIKESIQVQPEFVTTTMDGQEMVKVRDEIIPVIRLHDVYSIEPDNKELIEGLLVIVEHQNETISLFIDEIIGDQQTVIKGLSNYITDIPGISGCTILGNGEVSLILDIGGLIKRSQRETAM